MSRDTDRIRVLNDELRTNLSLGTAVMTPGIAALKASSIRRLIQTIATFSDFHLANDPYEEHDFGSFEFDGSHVVFKIDYYDKSLSQASPNAADPAVNERVFTLMLAHEY